MNIASRIVRWSVLCAAFLLATAHQATAQADGTVHEYLTRTEALEEALPKATRYVVDTLRLAPEALARTEQVLHRELKETSYEVVLGYDASGAFTGYAVISEEVGKYRPITYIVGITPDFAARKVAIMVYREDRGGEVRTPRFLYQYRGKTADDPIRTNRDIINVSGATLSVRAINAGVKKVLYLVTERYRTDPPPATYHDARTNAAGRKDG